MGYSTDFKGSLKFKTELKTSELSHLNKFLGSDLRAIDISGEEIKHGNSGEERPYSAYMVEGCGVCWCDLEITKDFSGIMWNGSEKTYGMVDMVNFITKIMKKIKPDFELAGTLHAQGEQFEDRWDLEMLNGKAIKSDMIIKGDVIECPNCEEKFILNK